MTMPRPAAARVAAASLAPLLVVGTACSGGDSDDGRPPAEVLAEAKRQLDDTSGVELSLTTDELPSGTDGVLKAVGTGTHAPAFEGEVTVMLNSLSLEVPVVAVGGTVYAKLPLTTRFREINPEEYGAPDPAGLLAPDGGISSWLTDTEDPTEGDQTRDGEQVLTSYTGTLPGDSVAAVIPSADRKADFDVTFEVDEDGRLHSADVVGPFYVGAPDVEYTIDLSGYGTDKEITAP